MDYPRHAEPKGNPLGIFEDDFRGVPNAGIIGNTTPYMSGFQWTTRAMSIRSPKNLSLVHSAHLFKAESRSNGFWRDIDGVSMRFGQFDFGVNALNPLDTNYAYSNAALGFYNRYDESNSRPRHFARGGRYDIYVQDTWKVTDRLTLDYGIACIT